MSYETRKADIKDLEVIQELSVRLSEKEEEQFDSTIDSDWNKTEEATDYFQERIEDQEGFAVVAEDNDKIVGYAVGGFGSSEEYREDLKIAELETMYVTPDYRSKGIGSEFMERFEDWAIDQAADRLRVEVTSQNDKGISFYQENGLEDYARIMEKEI